MKSIGVNCIAEKFELIPMNKVRKVKRVTVSDIKRPGLELAGFFDYFTPNRIQILGTTELSFLKELPKELMKERLHKFCSFDIPCIIIARGQDAPELLIELSEESEIPLFGTDYTTTSFIGRLTDYLEDKFALEITKHGVLVDVYGVGVFIKGESGIGKSESALDLVKKGHRLIADDAVIIRRFTRKSLIGRSPEISKHYMELRGLGIINVKTLFGAGAVKEEQTIDLVVELEQWDDTKNYDRLGIHEEKQEFIGVAVPKVIIPVRPGRNLAMVMEVAAMNYRLKTTGYNAAEEFTQRLEEALRE